MIVNTLSNKSSGIVCIEVESSRFTRTCIRKIEGERQGEGGGERGGEDKDVWRQGWTRGRRRR